MKEYQEQSSSKEALQCVSHQQLGQLSRTAQLFHAHVLFLCLLSSQTKQWVAELKMNGDVFGVSFTSDSCFMLSTGSE